MRRQAYSLKTIFLFTILSASAFGQSSLFLPAMRSTDDNRTLANDSLDWKWHRSLKEIRLQKNQEYPVMSFGGEIREQFRYYDHLNFGDVMAGANDEDIYMQHRLLAHADFSFNKYLRLFGQLNSCHANGRNPEMHHTDRDDLGVMQAFMDLNMPGSISSQLRIGRQELSYGAERLLALRDGPTIRQNFDGFRLALRKNFNSLDFMLVQPVVYLKGVFDNTRRKNEHIFGAYFTRINNIRSELYYFNAEFHEAIFAADTADDNRQYIGGRLYKYRNNFNFEIEYTWQWGKHGTDPIRAWHLSSAVAYHFSQLFFSPKITLKESIMTGDEKPGDGEINTFRPVSAKPPVYDLVPIGPGNIVFLSPEALFTLTDKLWVTFRYLNVSRFSENDGMYPSDMRKMTRIKDAETNHLGKHIINGVACDLEYIPDKHIAFLIYGGFFKAGNYIRHTGQGEDIAAFSVRIHYKF
jgi:hypothetical protein